MRRRKQRQNECFENIQERLMEMNDRLTTPLEEGDFVEVVV